MFYAPIFYILLFFFIIYYITNKIIRKQKNFWNNCIFHPTDAIEDPWGRRILDRIADDGAIDTLRIYAMLEDIVYLGENGEIKYDFRLSDTRLDYLVEKGYNLLIAYGGIPDCIAKSSVNKTSTTSSSFSSKTSSSQEGLQEKNITEIAIIRSTLSTFFKNIEAPHFY